MPAPTSRCHRCSTTRDRIRSATRNQSPAASALVSAASRLTRIATEGAIGSSANTRAISTNSGFPGGWGSPSTCATVMYSLVSHSAVVGPSVAT